MKSVDNGIIVFDNVKFFFNIGSFCNVLGMYYMIVVNIKFNLLFYIYRLLIIFLNLMDIVF